MDLETIFAQERASAWNQTFASLVAAVGAAQDLIDSSDLDTSMQPTGAAIETIWIIRQAGSYRLLRHDWVTAVARVTANGVDPWHDGRPAPTYSERKAQYDQAHRAH